MPARRDPQSLKLSAEERTQLESIARSRSLPAALSGRAKMILWTEQGLSDRETARRLQVSQPTVGLWRRRFQKARLAGLHEALRPGRPRTHDEQRIARLLNTALKTKPQAATHWSVRALGKATRISKTTVGRYLRLFGVQPHRTKGFKLSNDPFFIEKVREIVGLYLNPPQHALVLSVDEKTQIQALERTQPLLPMGLGYLEGLTHDYVRHGTTTLFAALDVANGRVIAQCKRRHRHQEFLAFLRHIELRVPERLDLHLILDNYASHKHPRVRAWLARRPRFHLHFTPTYASWLNQVEIWFGQITRQAIRRGSFDSVPDLRAKIERYVEHWNEHPQPFVWTATTESILAKLERLCKFINGTRH